MIFTPYCSYFTIGKYEDANHSNNACAINTTTWAPPHLQPFASYPLPRIQTKDTERSNMAKEMMIMFVYDTECCQNEADDPVDAVLYFHPSWVSDTQKLSLCGQLMGTVHFLQENFGKTNVIALQNGKFILKTFGRFILAVGTDRNISQSLLEHRAELLSSLVRLFHRDIQMIHDQFSATGQYKNLSEKLYHIFETYLPILQYNGNIFQNMPISKLPKSASNIFLEAMHTLQSCQRMVGVLGGSILYHNKIIASQLRSNLVKNLILTDPHRIKTTAESIPVKFHVPMGCQLITIFITQSEYNELLENADRIQTMSVNQENCTGNGNGTVNVNGNGNGKTNAYPLQFKKKVMKRDKSIVFTNIPEESNESGGSSSSSAFAFAFASTSSAPINGNIDQNNKMNNEMNFTSTQPATVRPNHLPLRFKNITSKDIPESGFSSSITFDEHDSFPQFIGRTSVCSTPMTENKVLHGNILPICGNPFNEKSIIPKAINVQDALQIESPPEANVIFNKHSSTVQIQQPIKSISAATAATKTDENIENGKDATKNLNKFNELPMHSFQAMGGLVNPLTQQWRRNSLIDISETFRKFSKHLSMRPISSGFSNFLQECDYVTDGKLYSSSNGNGNGNGNSNGHLYDCDDDLIDDVIDKKRYRTITDPTYPVFNSFGQPISRFLFEEFSAADKQDDLMSKNSRNYFEMKQFASHSSDMELNDTKNYSNSNLNSNGTPPVTADEVAIEAAAAAVTAITSKFEKPPLPISDNNIKRKSLSLPLKSLTSSRAVPIEEASTKNIFDKPEDRRKLSGIQLTPLITKLSILAMSEERSSGFSSWDITPGIELATPLDGAKQFRRRSSVKADDTDSFQNFDDNRNRSSDSNDLIKVELFICGQNNMTMLLILRESFGQKQENIQAMFDVCVSKLPRLEANLNQVLNINMNGDKTDGGYSFFCVDNDWDTLCRAGPWSNTDLTSIEYVQKDLQTNPKLHNITLRGEDSVIYSHKNIESNVFYKQSAQTLCGLPAPVDAMGIISKHARRHLERDHSVILF